MRSEMSLTLSINEKIFYSLFIDFEFKRLQYAKQLGLPDWANFEAKIPMMQWMYSNNDMLKFEMMCYYFTS